jgi:hypothetical protein
MFGISFRVLERLCKFICDFDAAGQRTGLLCIALIPIFTFSTAVSHPRTFSLSLKISLIATSNTASSFGFYKGRCNLAPL